MSLDDDVLILGVTLCRETGARHQLRDERISRVAEEGDEGTVQEVCILLDEVARIVSAAASEMVDTERHPVGRLGTAWGDEGGVYTKLRDKLLQRLLLFLLAALPRLEGGTCLVEYAEHAPRLPVCAFTELCTPQQLDATRVIHDGDGG